MPNSPIDQQDIIPIRRQGEFAGYQSYAVNFDYIARTGNIPRYTQLDILHRPQTAFYHIDWKADDAFTRALKTVETNAANDIRHSATLQKLLVKPDWNKKDREHWEQEVSRIVTQETARIPGFDQFREAVQQGGKAKDIQNLNDLKYDIENHTHTLRFDCSVESAVKGVVIQKLESGFLPTVGPQYSFKKASNYFYASGYLTENGVGAPKGGHASIFTPAGNMIESTLGSYQSQQSYNYSLYADSTLEGMVRGKPFFATSGYVYDQPVADGLHTDKLREAAAAAHTAGRDDGKILSASELLDRGRLSGTHVSQDPAHGLFFVVSARHVDTHNIYEFKAFQNQMVGTPHEGYVMVAGASHTSGPHDGPPEISCNYADTLANQTYTFRALFDRPNITLDIARDFNKPSPAIMPIMPAPLQHRPDGNNYALLKNEHVSAPGIEAAKTTVKSNASLKKIADYSNGAQRRTNILLP